MLRGDPIRGAHAFYAGSSREWWAPLRPGGRWCAATRSSGCTTSAATSPGAPCTSGPAEVFASRDPDEVLSAQYRLMIRTDRTKAEQRGKYDAIVIEPYTDDEIAEIDAVSAAERARRRGNEPRWWEDVEEGDEVGPLVKGPLRVTDMVCWHVGMGMGLYGVKALRLGYDQRQRVPRFFRPDDLNIPDVQQRVHWDPEWARRAGNPASYDYGRMRETWLIHLCTDWMGDDAWLWKLDCQFRKFNYVGDTHWMRGRVARKLLADGDRPAVELEIWGENQRGETTTPGHATILLPSREHGAGPTAGRARGGATTCAGRAGALVDRFAAMEAEEANA